ncbi:MAG: hypothetical protein H0W83_04580 [Planctomycetes bacterium]|nr:hypothetical protein [Planctomycetota bacterium]
MTTDSAFVALANELLSRSRLTPAMLAEKVRLPSRRVQDMLRGRQKPPDDLALWCTAFACSPAERQRLLDAAALAWLPAVYLPRFQTLVQDSAQLREIRGTMILADQLFQDNLTGKWVVAGTYSRWFTDKVELQIHNLQCYLRLQVERPGVYPGRIWCVDRSRAPNENKLWEIALPMSIPEEGLPVFEARIILPGMTVRSPVPIAKRKPGEAYALQTTLWLRVGNSEVASCPLDFIFIGPPQGTHPDVKNPDPTPERQ